MRTIFRTPPGEGIAAMPFISSRVSISSSASPDENGCCAMMVTLPCNVSSNITGVPVWRLMRSMS